MSEQDQVNRIAREVGGKLGRAIEAMQVRSGQPEVVVTPGFPASVIHYEHRKREMGEERRKQSSPFRFVGGRLIVEDENNGVWGAGSISLVGGATSWVATVMGLSFIDGRVMIEDARLPGGGVLAWKYELELTVQTPTSPYVKVEFSPNVDLVHGGSFPASSLPKVRVGYYDRSDSIEAVETSGVLYQVAGVYFEDGKVMLYRTRPGVDVNSVTELPYFRMPWFETVP